MSNSSLEKKLKEIGLEYKEIQVYLATLELGESLVSEIAKKAQVERVNSYYILEQLKNKGLISQSWRDAKKVFIATHPNHLVSLAEHQLSTANDLQSELLSIYNTIDYKPRIQYFEGEQGLASILDDILVTCLSLPPEKREILEFISPDSAIEMMKNEQLKFVEDRIKNKIYLRWIAPDTEFSRTFLKDIESAYRELRLVDPAKFPLTTEIDIYGDKMALFGSKEHPLGVIIEHKEMVETQRQIFELAWAGASSNSRIL